MAPVVVQVLGEEMQTADQPEHARGSLHLRIPGFAAGEQRRKARHAFLEGFANAVVHVGETQILRKGDLER